MIQSEQGFLLQAQGQWGTQVKKREWEHFLLLELKTFKFDVGNDLRLLKGEELLYGGGIRRNECFVTEGEKCKRTPNVMCVFRSRIVTWRGWSMAEAVLFGG